MTSAVPLKECTLPLPLYRRGKVRDVFEVDAERLLVVATDRVSAFDVVMNEAVPHKGAVLTQLTAWWLRQFESEVAHHMISANASEIITALPSLAPHRRELSGRAMLCKKSQVYPVECVVRGYITGSAWKEYSAKGTLAGVQLPKGLTESAKFPEPVFSPATKAEEGHDENIPMYKVAEMVGGHTADELQRLSIRLYERGRDIAAERGIIVADTKFEFGVQEARILLVDEVLTPDSSRFWPRDAYAPGRPQPSFDKQPLRDYLNKERQAGRWNGDAPPPPLPPEVVQATSDRYLDAYRRITGADLPLSE